MIQDIQKLINELDSIYLEEAEMWYELLPHMSQKQLSELKLILETEKRKLEEIDSKYAKPIF